MKQKIYYVDHDEKGFSRKRHGSKFEYFTTDNKKISNKKILARISSLKIPPGYRKARQNGQNG